MSPAVTHRLTDSGVTLAVLEGSIVRLHAVSDGDARRLAWAILADLEPEEQPTSAVRPRRRSEAPLQELLLRALKEGPATRHDLTRRARVVISGNSICFADYLLVVSPLRPAAAVSHHP